MIDRAQESDFLSLVHTISPLVRDRKPFTIILDGMPIRVIEPSELFVRDDLYELFRNKHEGIWMDGEKLYAFKHSTGGWAISGRIQGDGKAADFVRLEFEPSRISGIIHEANDLYRDKQ